MSDILADIDDTLADWNGSADSMRWRPDGSGAEPRVFTAPEAGWYQFGRALQSAFEFRPAMVELTTSPGLSHADVEGIGEQLLADYAGALSFDIQFPLAEPTMGQGYWQIQAVRRPIAAAFQVSLAELGIPTRYRLDARYHQRQKNRRKRRR